MPTLYASEKTDSGMLPQSRTLESTSADNPRVGTKRGVDSRRVTGRTTGVQLGRGETPVGITNRQERHSSKPEQSGGGEDRGFAVPPSIRASRVFVLDMHGHPLMPCHPARARKLLSSGRARVHRLAPFVIRLVDRVVEQSEVPGVEVGIDPGSKFTGVSVFRVSTENLRHGLISIEIGHRGQLIHKHMGQRSNYRRRRRTANLRYRKPRWSNRSPKSCASCGKNARHKSRYCRPCASARSFVDSGYRRHRLPPSLQHRVDSTMSMVSRLRKWAPVTAIHQELVRFDMQQMENPDISSVEYQQGTLAGYEVREYLLEKWGRQCAYCGASGVPLQVEHIRAKSWGGTDRVSNLALACGDCNQAKGALTVEEFLAGDPERLAKILARAKAPLKDAAAVNATRWALWRALKNTGLPVFIGSGGRTKWNRSRFGVPKTHTLDAICVGEVGGVVSYPAQVIVARSTGRGGYSRTRPDRYGFPRLSLPRTKVHYGFATGDLVRAVVPSGKHKGVHIGRVAVRSRPSFFTSGVGNIHPKHLSLLQRSDGWNWSLSTERRPPLLPALKDGVPAAK
ncbi:MAG: RNA-guided endonuclease IscB [Acidimicrobiales bacterium]